MRLERLDPRSPAVSTLITLSDAYMAALYPAESNHLESVEALARPDVYFLGGYLGETLVTCGAVKTMQDDGHYGEIKRVFVVEAQRGRGYSTRIMQALETHLRTQGAPVARLETGIRQPEALALYRKLGYRERGPFGSYAADPLSVFMEKWL